MGFCQIILVNWYNFYSLDFFIQVRLIRHPLEDAGGWGTSFVMEGDLILRMESSGQTDLEELDFKRKCTNRPRISFRSPTNVWSSRESLLSVMADLIECSRKCSFCFYFLQEIVRNIISYNFFFKCLVELTSEISGPYILFFGKFLIINSISLFHFSSYRYFSI